MVKIGFLGFGQMASALARGIAKEGHPAGDIYAFDVFPSAAENITRAGFNKCDSATDVAAAVDIMVIAVKPQVAPEVLRKLNFADLPKQPMILSIVAALEIASIQKFLMGKNVQDLAQDKIPRVVRVMPNTPCLVGLSASAYSPSKGVSQDDIAEVEKILNAVGLCMRVPENLLHAVTGVSGSGPAYIYMVIDAMAEAGVKHGLSRDQSVQLAAQTCLGAAKMVLDYPEIHVMQHKDNVSSPGGTTIAATCALREAGLHTAIHEGVDACIERSLELAEVDDSDSDSD